jgi:hypothetical protein
MRVNVCDKLKILVTDDLFLIRVFIFQDKLLTICRLIIMHPCFTNAWMKLCDMLDQNKKQFLSCYLVTKELIKSAKANRKEKIGVKRNLIEKDWIECKESSGLSELTDDLASNSIRNLSHTALHEKLESADKIDEFEKICTARNLDKFETFYNLWIVEKIIK